MPNHQMLPNPIGCRSLTDPEASRLQSQDAHLWLTPKTTCLTCTKESHGGVATFRTREYGEIVTYDCSCMEQWKLHRWLLNAGVDKRYQRFSWDDATHVNGDAQSAVMRYVVNAPSQISRGDGLTLWSEGRGTGKTLLASLLLKGLMADGHDGYFTQFNEMLENYTAGWRNQDERAWFTRRVRNAGVLVVDDMGRENKGRANITESMFDTVIRARVAACKPTIITTNYTPDQLFQGYGSNVMSLLNEVNSYVEVSGIDYRPVVREQRVQDGLDGIVYPIVVK